MELKQTHKSSKTRKQQGIFVVKKMLKFKDEKHVTFWSGLGSFLGEAMINKADIELLKEFGKISRYTNVIVEKK